MDGLDFVEKILPGFDKDIGELLVVLHRPTLSVEGPFDGSILFLDLGQQSLLELGNYCGL